MSNERVSPSVRADQSFHEFLQTYGVGRPNRNGDILPFPVPAEHLQDANGGYIVPDAIAGQLTQAAFRDALRLTGQVVDDNNRYRQHLVTATTAFLGALEERDPIVNMTEHLFSCDRSEIDARLFNIQQILTAVTHALGVR